MEINFKNRTVPVYKELSYQTKVVQEVCEAVVPDTDEDIGSVAAVQSQVFLKSKDVTPRGVLISGEACASLMYITESQDKVSYMKLKRTFSMEYEIADIDSEALSQINLYIISAEARLINPRKVSVCFEIAGERSCYISEELDVEYLAPASDEVLIHAKYESAELNVVSSVNEKTFSINEQFSFPGGKPTPSRLVFADADIAINDTQLIGTKVIVKGSAAVSVSYLSDEVNYPVKAEFTAPFSQIVDIGEAVMENCTVTATLTGMYYNVADSIGGDKLMDIELHTLLQLCCRSSREIVYVSDAYSNVMPANCVREKRKLQHVSQSRKVKMSSDERLSIADDCSDVLSLFAVLSGLRQEQETVSATVNLDIVYRDSSGKISSARRSINIKTENAMQCCRVQSAKLADVYLRPDGQYLDCHLAVELCCLVCGSLELECVKTVTLDEDAAIELEKFPTVCLVRCSGESLWELAKTYHSSVEKIREANDMEDDINGRMILVPKCI